MPKTTKNDTVKFGELPPGTERQNGQGNWAVASALRERPGEWALAFQTDNQSQAYNKASNIQRGVISAFRPHGTFEAVTRGLDVWARYVGEQS